MPVGGGGGQSRHTWALRAGGQARANTSVCFCLAGGSTDTADKAPPQQGALMGWPMLFSMTSAVFAPHLLRGRACVPTGPYPGAPVSPPRFGCRQLHLIAVVSLHPSVAWVQMSGFCRARGSRGTEWPWRRGSAAKLPALPVAPV